MKSANKQSVKAVRKRKSNAAVSRLGNNLNRSSLRKLLGLFFVAMALPIGVLVWHAYNQLKWESFHQYRTFAEELAGRIDQELSELAAVEQLRPISDFTFYSDQIGGATVANARLRSPLSVFLPDGEPAGILGYFQVDGEGRFTTPLLPELTDESALAIAGLTEQDRQIRQQSAAELAGILNSNELLDSTNSVEMVGNASDREVEPEGLSQPDANSVQDIQIAGERDRSKTIEDSLEEQAAVSPAPSRKENSQIAFDRLNSIAGKKQERVPVAVTKRDLPALSSSSVRQSVSELELDSSYERKSQVYERKQRSTENLQRGFSETTPSSIAVESEIAETAKMKKMPSDEIGSLISPTSDSGTAGSDLRIRGFSEDVGILEFSMLETGHFILFRRVWNNDERLIQGLLVNPEIFLNSLFGQSFAASAVSGTSDLLVAFEDEVVVNYRQSESRLYSPRQSKTQQSGLRSATLYRQHLTAPFGRMQLLFSIRELPPGPGASVLAWVTLALALALCGGFYLLYRAGLKQIALSRQQQNFVSSISHELKTPLTSIRMYSEMLKSGWVDETKKNEYYNYIHDESERLSRLISNVLRLSSINNNDLTTQTGPVKVKTLLDQVRSRTGVQLEQSGMTASYTATPQLLDQQVDVDEDAFIQIFINLIDNAIKFSRNTGNSRIEISCQVRGTDEIMFAVRDYGPGIPTDQLKKIFELFYRSEDELTRETVGTGIGLAIVHQLSRLMGGRVDVVNRDPGAEFRLFMPITGPDSNSG